MPDRMSAIATTTPKSAVLSARKETFSAVESAVSVTQMFRAPFEIGFPFSSFCAAAGSFVPAGSLGLGQPTGTGRSPLERRPPVVSSAWIRM